MNRQSTKVLHLLSPFRKEKSKKSYSQYECEQVSIIESMKKSAEKPVKKANGQSRKGGATVLIVEDETSLNEAYQIILSQAGYNVKVAYDGSEALERCSESEPDVILLDLRMPVMSGLEFLKHYKPKKDRAHIVVFSNYDMQKEIDEAYKLGADRYILKAWASPKELLQIVRDAVNS